MVGAINLECAPYLSCTPLHDQKGAKILSAVLYRFGHRCGANPPSPGNWNGWPLVGIQVSLVGDKNFPINVLPDLVWSL